MDDAQVTTDQQVQPDEANDETTLTTESQPEEVQETDSEPVDSPSPTFDESQEEDEEDSYTGFNVQAPQFDAPLLDLSALPTGEDGTIDAEALAQAMAQRDNHILQQAANMVQQQEENRQEERLWQKARELKPELRDKETIREVNALRFGLFAEAVNNGSENAKLLTPLQTYARMEKRFSQAKAEGVRQATESIRVQESAYVEPTQSANKSDKSDEQKLFQQMRSPNRAEAEAATDKLLRSRLFG